MDERPGGQPGDVMYARREPPGDDGSDVTPLLVRPTSHLRSPIAEERSIELLSPDPDRPSLVVPPPRELIRTLAWAVVPAIPFLVLAGWQPALMAGAVVLLVREIDRRAGRPTLLFADGFLRFRGDEARAPGIQEEDDVRWTWSGGALTGGREDDARPSWPGSISP